jgi:hypothetical protein
MESLSRVLAAPAELPPASLLLIIEVLAVSVGAVLGDQSGVGGAAGAALATAVTTVFGGAVYAGASAASRKPERQMRRRLGDVVRSLGEPVVVP